MTGIADSPLGKATAMPTRYAPELLHPIARSQARDTLALPDGHAWSGVDLWTAWELSWLDLKGKPEVAVGRLRLDANSPNIIESKSLKLYLNSLNDTRYASREAVAEVIATDLAGSAGAAVGVELLALDDPRLVVRPLHGESLDAEAIETDRYTVAPELLDGAARGGAVEETLTSNLLRSLCPVTAQPDWGSVQIRYRGPRIDRVALLRYLVSYRNNAEFHEHCVERIYIDLLRRCQPETLSVYARYVRRGGLDINPFRSHGDAAPDEARVARQ